MKESFVVMRDTDSYPRLTRDIWTVTIADGMYLIAINGQKICYGTAKDGQSCEDILRSFCGMSFSKVG